MRDMSPQDSNPERLGAGAGDQPQARRRGFDYLIVGAGFAGSVLAERLASGLNKRVLVVDRRPHIAGNAYDYHDESGVLIHRYGPHIFHTNAQRIVDTSRSSPSGARTNIACWRRWMARKCRSRST